MTPAAKFCLMVKYLNLNNISIADLFSYSFIYVINITINDATAQFPRRCDMCISTVSAENFIWHYFPTASAR